MITACPSNYLSMGALAELIGVTDKAIPYWIIQDDLPYLPPDGAEREPEVRIVTVCSCGEYGCGHTECRVVQDGRVVTFLDFGVGASAEGRKQVFRFSAENYDTVVGEIVHHARGFALRA